MRLTLLSGALAAAIALLFGACAADHGSGRASGHISGGGSASGSVSGAR